MARTPLIWLLLAFFISLSSAGAPTFCKCTCFKNSTIIPLGPEHYQDGDASLLRRSLWSPDDAPTLDRRIASTSCSECTRAFCLSQGIDICENAKEDDVVTLCFKRDSNKDKIIVWAFMIGTIGLLGYSLFKHVVSLRRERAAAQEALNYAPVSTGGR